MTSPPNDPKNFSFVFATAVVQDGRPPEEEPITVDATAFCAWRWNTTRVGPPTPPVYPDQQLNPGPVSFFPYPVRDPNNLPLTFSLVTPLPPSLQINPSTGEIYGTLDALDWDFSTCQVQVSNGSFSITGPVFNLYSYAFGGTTSRATVYGIEYALHRFEVDSFAVSGQSIKTFEVTRNIPYAEYLLVGGGGGGGTYIGGGGGGGGVRLGNTSFGVGTFSATVGNGGPAATVGFNSSLGSVVALGGGAGGSSGAPASGQSGVRASNGGSGGGGGITQQSNAGVVNNNLPGTASAGQGNDGGAGNPGYTWTFGDGTPGDIHYARRGSGGGGGAGAAGGGGGFEVGGNGGAGIGILFGGALTYYAGGGGGSTAGFIQGTGGIGGGGTVGTPNGVAGTGGGGAGGTSTVGGSGGSGVVIVRYPLYPEPAGVKRFGLVQWLDAADYTSGAAVWNDRTANYDASMFNSPVKDADGGGSIVFNGTTNRGSYDTPLEVTPLSSFALELWAKWTTTGTSSASIQTILDNSSTLDAPSFTLQDRPDLGKALAFEYRQSSGTTTLLSSSLVGDGSWHHVVISGDFNTPSVRMFVDGELSNTVLSPSLSNRVIKSTTSIGRWNAGASPGTPRYYTGKLAILRTYARALTSDEVFNNYVTEVSRFGSSPFAASGGVLTITAIGDTVYRTHTFFPSTLDGISDGTFTVLNPIASADYIVVGGGGGGGADGGGGGGAGGFLSGSRAFSAGAYAANTGAGGAGAASTSVRGTSGFNTTLDALVALGGGGGASRLDGLNAAVGGSGGGGSGQFSGTRYLGAAGTAGQGNAGGNGTGPADAGTSSAGGGGGGSGAAGSVASPLIAGAGGIGTLVTLSGLPTYYAGGGGGGIAANGTIGSGGRGGGGSGSSTAGVAGTARFGGGGGGGGATGGRGGSGVIVIRYPTGSAAPVVDPNFADAQLLIPAFGYANATVSNWRDFSAQPKVYNPQAVASFDGTGDYLTVPAGYAPSDPFGGSVVLLLHCDGTNGSTTFTDSSLNPIAVTANGNVQVSTARSRWGTGSALFDGTGDQLTFPNITINASEDFTVECWVFKTAVDASGYTVLFGGTTQNIQFAFDYSGVAGSIGLVLQGSSIIAPSGTAVTPNTWHHLAWTRQGSTCRAFVNGVLQGTGTTTTSFIIARIGAFEAGGYEMNGNVDDVRITKGVCRYTENFTPPTGPFPDPSRAFIFGTGDFTVESWVYATGASSRLFFDTRPSGGTGAYPALYLTASNQFAYNVNAADLITSSAVTPNAWHHVALARKSGVSALFVNGAPAGRAADTTNLLVGSLVGIGANTNNTSLANWSGSLSNFRITKGVARYEPTYTQPTAELPDRAAATPGDTSFASVSFLLRMSGPTGGTTFVDSSLNSLVVTRQGSAVLAAPSPFTDTRSVTFSAAADYLSVAGGSHFTFPADFTIETWVYLTATGPRAGTDDGYGGAAVFSCTNGGGPATVLTYFNISTYRADFNAPITAWAFTYNLTGSQPSTALLGASAPQANVWTHVAVTRSGNTLRLFVNGTLEATATAAGTFNNTAFSPRIGSIDYTYTRNLQGYVADTRVTKGVARYTASFTPPTASFPSTVAAAAADPYYSTDVLLLRGNGANASTNFVDLGPNTLAVTPVGNAQISNVQSKWGGSSMLFDGSGDRLSLGTNATLFGFGADDFTIECWFYIAGNSPLSAGSTRVATFCSCYPTTGTITGYNFYIAGNSTTTGTGIGFESVQAGTNSSVGATVTVAQGVWHHAAVSRRGTLTRLFLDGVCVAVTTLGNQTVSAPNPLLVGGTQYTGYTYDLNGYIDDFRISKVARYVGNFVPPQRYNTGGADPNFSNVSLLLPLDELAGSRSFTDSGPDAFPVTTVGDVIAINPSVGAWDSNTPKNYGGAVALDGTANSFLSTLPTTFPPYVDGDFTLECWLNSSSASATAKGVLVGGDYNKAGGSSVGLWMASTALQVRRAVNGAGSVVITTPITTGLWYHVALCRRAGILYLYLNGNGVGAVVDSTRYYDSNFSIGASRSTSGDATLYPMTGYLQDVRAYSVAKYPVSADPQFHFVTLLLHCDGSDGSTVITDSSFSSTAVTAQGNAQISTARSRWGTASLLLDGTADYLTIPAFVIGVSEDFTLECWIYKTAVDASGYSSLFSGADSGNTLFDVDRTTAGSVSMILRGTTVISPVGNAVTLNAWHHIAYTRQGSTCRIFVNGVQQGSGTSTSGFQITDIGRWYGGGAEFNGNMDDVRITKGFCRYTANFTPPTAAFPDRPSFIPPTALMK